MSDGEPEVEVTGTPEETAPAETPEPVPAEDPAPPLEPSSTPSTEPDAPAAVPTPIDTPVSDPAAPEEPANPTPVAEPPPVANVVEVPPEPVAPDPPPPPAEAVSAINAADIQAQADQAAKEAADRLALSTNTPATVPILPPPLAGVADVPTTAVPATPVDNQIWICVTEEGPRTRINNVACPVFMVEKIPPQGQLIACPTCGGTTVRQATADEQRLPQTAGV